MRLGQARHWQVGLSHQQEQILVAVDTERLHRPAVVNAAQ